MIPRPLFIALLAGACAGEAAKNAAPSSGAPSSTTGHTPPPVPSAGSGYGLGGATSSAGAAGRSSTPAHPGHAGSAGTAPSRGAGGAGGESGEAGAGGETSDTTSGGMGPGGTGGDDFTLPLPPGFPPPAFPDGKSVTSPCVELGRYLFYDRRLSGNQTQSCSDCHQQALAFTDGRATPVGSTGTTIPRAAPSLANVAYYSVLTWQNPLMATLEQQALVPMFNDNPVELGLGQIDDFIARLRGVPEYERLFPEAFPDKAEPFELASVTDSLACFERTLYSGHSPYDDYVYGGNDAALSDAAKRGLALFFSEKADCYHCHSGFDFTDDTRTGVSQHAVVAYHNTGLYNLDAVGSYPAPNTGEASITGSASDMGKFRTPTLRNVELTAPYMHDGSVATLDEVVRIYNAGGRNITSGPNAGDGRANPLKDPLVRSLGMDDQELSDLVEFLKSLTDPVLISDPSYSNPWP